MSKIEWTGITWNPITGCDKVSQGCKNCYAETMSKRLKGMGQKKYQNGFKLSLHPEELEKPFSWKKPQMVFVCSMSDLFHKDVPMEFIWDIFEVMKKNPQHTFQVLTKRSERMYYACNGMTIPENVWMGVSVENIKQRGRIYDLNLVAAKTRFLSCEPLLGPLDNLPLNYIHWVIAGGESGPKARPIDPDWLRSLRDQCQEKQIPFFFKQWGGKNKKKAGRILDGREWNQMPQILTV